MKKASAFKRSDDLRREYDLSQLKGGVRGKYYQRATAGMNLVLIEPDLPSLFPDRESVNRALRVLADAAPVLRKRLLHWPESVRLATLPKKKDVSLTRTNPISGGNGGCHLPLPRKQYDAGPVALP